MFVVIIIAVAAVNVFALLRIIDDKSPVNTQSPAKKSLNNNKKKNKSYPLIDLRPTVDAWAARQSGAASVVVYDLANDKIIATLNPDTQYFTASLYKLYVAYIGYQRVADGTFSLTDPYLSGYNRGACLDAMIRNSYSPCGEKMWNELGKQKITNAIKEYGLKNTDLTGLYTSARDATIILQRLFGRRDLSEKYTMSYLDSLKTQPALYRRGLPSGFNDSTVYNKVGWNGSVEWHDAAIVTLPNDRSYVVVVLTENVGTKNIIDLGKAIEAKLSK